MKVPNNSLADLERPWNMVFDAIFRLWSYLISRLCDYYCWEETIKRLRMSNASPLIRMAPTTEGKSALCTHADTPNSSAIIEERLTGPSGERGEIA